MVKTNQTYCLISSEDVATPPIQIFKIRSYIYDYILWPQKVKIR